MLKYVTKRACLLAAIKKTFCSCGKMPSLNFHFFTVLFFSYVSCLYSKQNKTIRILE